MTKLIKDFKIFPSGSYAYNLSRELRSEEDTIQLLNELSKEHINKI